MKKLMLGNEAVARGAYEAGVRVVSSYPGTPSTEITECMAKFDNVFVEWATNEKVACEVAIGASIGGARSMTCMKHVGLNVCADPVFTASYTGVTGGMVICVADDPGMHSSQNEQDSRHYARAAKIMMLEPSDSRECLEYTKKAFELSEKFDTPVMIRLSTRVSHSQSLVTESPREEIPVKAYEKNVPKYVMMPGYAKMRHTVVEERMNKIREFAATTELNTVEINSKEIGVITSGTSHVYAKEAFGDKVSYLKLGMVYPLSKELISDFVSKHTAVYVIEELDPVIEEQILAMGINVEGKKHFTLEGEYSAQYLRNKVLFEDPPAHAMQDEAVPARPPVMCAGCPHRGAFYVLKKMGLTVSGDIGCYTLGAVAPLDSIDSTICMGASVSALHGFLQAQGKDAKAVAVIGDSTFLHSGITGLIDIVYNKGNATVIILDNSITGMTGHQNNPATGYTIRGEETAAVDLEALVRAIGIKRVTVADPFDVKKFESIVKAELNTDEPSVIIAQRPCALLKTCKYEGNYVINDKCKNCRMCMKLGCPAISVLDDKVVIDKNQCNGCGLCINVCPFGAIEKEEN